MSESCPPQMNYKFKFKSLGHTVQLADRALASKA